MTASTVEASDLGKRFDIYQRPLDRLSWKLLRGRRTQPYELWALREVDLSIAAGKCLGVIGPNGAGKSTLLKLMTGVIRPTEGSLRLEARPLALLELGTGFNAELTGRENVFATGDLLGYSPDHMRNRLEGIREFADIGDYFDRPIRIYSSGMLVRLAFSFYVNLDATILIIDEALSVGDFFFQQKCAGIMREIKQRGTTILLVSHDTAAIHEMADEVVLLDAGRIVERGDANNVISRYHALEDSPSRQPAMDAFAGQVDGENPMGESMKRWADDIVANDVVAAAPGTGKGGAKIVALQVHDANGTHRQRFTAGENLVLDVLLQANKHIPYANFGVLLADSEDRCIWSTATSNHGVWFGTLESGDSVIVRCEVTLNVAPGIYSLNVSTGEVDPIDAAYAIWNDLRPGSLQIEVLAAEGDADRSGFVDVPMEVAVL